MMTRIEAADLLAGRIVVLKAEIDEFADQIADSARRRGGADAVSALRDEMHATGREVEALDLAIAALRRWQDVEAAAMLSAVRREHSPTNPDAIAWGGWLLEAGARSSTRVPLFVVSDQALASRLTAAGYRVVE